MLTAKRKHLIMWLLALLSTGFVALSIAVAILPTSFIDLEFSKEVQEYQNPLLDTMMEWISWFGYTTGTLTTVGGVAILLWIGKYKRSAIFILLTLLSSIVSTIVKLVVNRPRPSSNLVRIVLATHQQSFPSGHVIFYVVFFGFIALLMYQLKSIHKLLRICAGAISLFLIFTVPLSRIYLGAHWFTDVLGGFLLGILCLAALVYFYEKTPEI